MQRGMTCVGQPVRGGHDYTWAWYALKSIPQGFVSVLWDKFSNPSAREPAMAEPDPLLWEAMERTAEIISRFECLASKEGEPVTSKFTGEYVVSSEDLRKTLWDLYERRLEEGDSFLIPVKDFHLVHGRYSEGPDATIVHYPEGDVIIPHVRYDFRCASDTR